ncbi:MAG: hypothetical protein ABSA96_14430 [Candidatus Acidiferrales bacterium]|jgi:hypothetical protein
MELQHSAKLEAASASVRPGILVAISANSEAATKNLLAICHRLIKFRFLTIPQVRGSVQLPTQAIARNRLDTRGRSRQYQRMAYSFLVFNFGGNEDVAQQARHKVDAWKQGFRLDKKLQLKFDRKEPEAEQEAEPNLSAKEIDEGSKSKGKSKTKSKREVDAGPGTTSIPESPSEIRLIVRLDFSDHEKLSHQRWLDRIPQEEPFKTAKARIVRPGDSEFEKTSDFYDSLD